MPHLPLPVSNSVSQKLIGELLNEQFMVPAYQRGYRWKEKQVTDLLNDLADFAEHGQPHTSYCLQPVIIKQQGGYYELIDGQQRLTTIHILLNYFRKQAPASAETPFVLQYETRPESRAFLEALDDTKRHKNIDFHHMRAAYDCITQWAQHPSRAEAAEKLHQTLLHRVCIIWYEVAADADPHAIFIRINSGKIPLTNAELIKALFLKRNAATANNVEFRRRQQEMATEWDYMEAELRRNEFWYFLNKNPPAQPSRMDFLLHSVAKPTAGQRDEYALFYHFSEQLAGGSVEEISRYWQKVKNRFLLLQSWFEDWKLYHWIGYLLAVDEPLKNLVQMGTSLSKTAFKKYLAKRICAKMPPSVDDLRYRNPDSPGDNAWLLQVLLLFNVETVRQNARASQRFPFHHYKGNGVEAHKWSLEHIHAQQEGRISSEKARVWLGEVKPFVEAEVTLPELAAPTAEGEDQQLSPRALVSAITQLLAAREWDDVAFEQIQEQVFTLFGRPELHALTNLALLTTRDNSALNNGPFPVKRDKIIKLERKGSFIPIATRNVFLKYYSQPAGHLYYWTETDRAAYLTEIKKILADYLNSTAAA